MNYSITVGTRFCAYHASGQSSLSGVASHLVTAGLTFLSLPIMLDVCFILLFYSCADAKGSKPNPPMLTPKPEPPDYPKGRGQTFAVCLDCGMHLAYDLNAMRVQTSAPGSWLDQQTFERAKKKAPDIQSHGSVPSAPASRETMRNDLPRRRLDFGTIAVLCVGAMSLVGSFLYSSHRPAGPKPPTTREQARPSLSADSVKSSPSLPVQESGTELTLASESGTLATPTVSTEPRPITGKKTIESDSISAAASPRSNQALRLEGNGSVIVLGREAGAALELSQHPERLRTLIRRGSLFAVPRRTATKLLQGNRLGNRFVMKALIMEGSMVGREGLTQTSQVSP